MSESNTNIDYLSDASSYNQVKQSDIDFSALMPSFTAITTTIGGMQQATMVASISYDMKTTSGGDELFINQFDPRFPKWICIFLLVTGFVGNILCLVVFGQKHMRKNSTFIYLAFLSVVDLIVLLLGLGDIILTTYFQVSLFEEKNYFLNSYA